MLFERGVRMLSITIPGRGSLHLSNLVLDFNGTIALDGQMIEGVKERLSDLSSHVSIFVLTADTHGNVIEQCRELPVTVHIIGKENQELEKRRFIQKLSPDKSAVIGNGANDSGMFEEAEVAIAIMGREGCASLSLMKSDVVVTHIFDALDLLIKEKRLIATLRT